jgi:alcohol dehydrogenase
VSDVYSFDSDAAAPTDVQRRRLFLQQLRQAASATPGQTTSAPAPQSIPNVDPSAVPAVQASAPGGERGVDTAIEAVGIPATFELCEKIVAPGGTIANIGVHGMKVALHLERLWDRNITITTRLVDTVSTPMLLNILRSHKFDPKLLITHRFKLDRILDAYETFGKAANSKALKVTVEA